MARSRSASPPGRASGVGAVGAGLGAGGTSAGGSSRSPWGFTNTSGAPVYLVDAITVRNTTGWEIYLAQAQDGEEEARAFFDTMLATFSFEE